MLLRERLQLLHIIHCYFHQGGQSFPIFRLITDHRWTLVNPRKLYNNFLMVFPSWKCCAKFLSSIHSRNVWMSWSGGLWMKNGKNSWSPPQEAYEKEQKEKSKVMLVLVVYATESAENVDRNKVVGRNKYFKKNSRRTWNNFIAIRGSLFLPNIRNILILCTCILNQAEELVGCV